MEKCWLDQVNSSLNSRSTGQILMAIGGISILAIIFLIIFFIGYLQDIPSILFFGPLNDVFGSLEAIMSAVLATIFIFSQAKRWIWLNLLGAILSWTGAFIVTLDSLMAGGLLPRNAGAILRISYGFPALLTTNDLHFGFGLIGAWLVILNFQAFRVGSWPTPLIRLGFLTGVLMMTGFAGSLGGLGLVFLYPIWCIWLGHQILKYPRISR